MRQDPAPIVCEFHMPRNMSNLAETSKSGGDAAAFAGGRDRDLAHTPPASEQVAPGRSGRRRGGVRGRARLGSAARRNSGRPRQCRKCSGKATGEHVARAARRPKIDLYQPTDGTGERNSEKSYGLVEKVAVPREHGVVSPAQSSPTRSGYLQPGSRGRRCPGFARTMALRDRVSGRSAC